MRTLMLCFAVLAVAARAGAQEPEPADNVAVKLASEPKGAQVYVDGKKSCVAPCLAKVFRGTHVFGMSLHGFMAREEVVDCQADRTISWKLKVEHGRLSVSSSPEGMEVVIRPAKGKGDRRVRTPVTDLELAPGSYEVTVTDQRFEAQKRTVEVPPGDGVDVELAPRAIRGTLRVSVVDEAGDPDIADVLLDGKRQKGTGPWPLSPGKHRLVVKKDGKVLLDQETTVEAGGDVELEVNTMPEGE